MTFDTIFSSIYTFHSIGANTYHSKNLSWCIYGNFKALYQKSPQIFPSLNI